MDVREKLIHTIEEASGCLRYYAELIADKLLTEGVIANLREEIDQLRVRHAAYDKQLKAGAIKRFAERLKKYYFNTVNGSTPTPLVAYHIDQILSDELKKLEGANNDV